MIGIAKRWFGFSLDEAGAVRVQGRGSYLEPGGHPQYQALWPWLDARRPALASALAGGLMVFGEWCFATHSVRYERLPDWFVAFDVYDRAAGRFWSVASRNDWLDAIGLARVPRVATGRFTIEAIAALLGVSNFGSSPMEGLYVRRDEGAWLAERAKLVRPEFIQAIDEHWSQRKLARNALGSSAVRRRRDERGSPPRAED